MGRTHDDSHPIQELVPIYCVRGRGRSDQHRKGTKEPEKRLPTIVMDYAYLNSEEGEDKRPILVMQDEKSGKIMANMVPRKGEDAKAIAIGSRELKKLSYGRMIWKSDSQ